MQAAIIAQQLHCTAVAAATVKQYPMIRVLQHVRNSVCIKSAAGVPGPTYACMLYLLLLLLLLLWRRTDATAVVICCWRVSSHLDCGECCCVCLQRLALLLLNGEQLHQTARQLRPAGATRIAAAGKAGKVS
jgi:hypothetical protein